MPLSKLFTTKPDKPPPPPEPTRAEKLVASVQPETEPDTPYAAGLIELYGEVREHNHAALCRALEVLVLLVAELPAPFTEEPYGFLRRQLDQAHDGLAEIKRLRPAWARRSSPRPADYAATHNRQSRVLGTGLPTTQRRTALAS